MSRNPSKNEIELMRKSGEISARALKKALEAVKEGVSLPEIEEVAREEILRLGGKESFKSVDNYFWATCITVNDEVVHGRPDRRIVLKKGDKVSIDLGAVYQGWHTDTAWSVIVGYNPVVPAEAGIQNGMDSGSSTSGMTGKKPEDDKKKKFLSVGEEALWKGIKEAKVGNRIGDIAESIQKTVEGGGFEVVRSLVGHGVGRELHEEPEVPGFGKKSSGEELFENETLAIEVIYTESAQDVVLEEDGWTISSEDGSLGGLFEMTVIVGKEKAEVLTDWRKY